MRAFVRADRACTGARFGEPQSSAQAPSFAEQFGDPTYAPRHASEQAQDENHDEHEPEGRARSNERKIDLHQLGIQCGDHKRQERRKKDREREQYAHERDDTSIKPRLPELEKRPTPSAPGN